MKIWPTVVLINILAAQPRAPDDARHQAKELWERMIAAKGGRDNLANVRSIEETARRRLRKVPGRWWLKKDTTSYMVRLFVIPDRMWQWSDEGASVLGLHLQVCNLTQHVQYDTEKGDYLRKSYVTWSWQLWLAQLVYLNETSGVHPEPIGLIPGEQTPRDAEVLQTKVGMPNTPRADFYISKVTHLPVRIVVWQGLHKPDTYGKSQYDLGAYADMDGVMIPTVIYESTILPGMISQDNFRWDYQVQLNVPYRDKAFTEVPSIENGPYARMPGNS